MNRRRIIHTTTYRYSEPVSFGPHHLVVRPREGHDLQVLEQDLRIRPASRVSWHRDLFGNSIAEVMFTESAKLLEFRNDVTIVRGKFRPGPIQLGALPVPFPVAYSALENPVASGYLTSVFPEESSDLGQWVRERFAPLNGSDVVSLVQGMGMWIYRNIRYRRREDRGVQTPLETLRLSSGSCRDMATLLLEAARAAGVAARFASGYLDSAASAAGVAATHAWTEVYFPDHGWYGYDPTLGEGTSFKHIVTGVSSHPRGVMPVSGSFSGKGDPYLGMTVTVKIEGGNEDEIPGASIHPSDPGMPIS